MGSSSVGGFGVKYLRFIVVFLLFIFSAIFINLFSSDDTNSKGIYYSNFQYTNNVNFLGSHGIQMDYSAELNKIGDFYEISFDVVNDNPYDVEIVDCFYHEDDSYIKYQLSYQDGSSIKNGDILNSGQSKRILYRVSYFNEVDSQDYSFDTSFFINYQQAL